MAIDYIKVTENNAEAAEQRATRLRAAVTAWKEIGPILEKLDFEAISLTSPQSVMFVKKDAFLAAKNLVTICEKMGFKFRPVNGGMMRGWLNGSLKGVVIKMHIQVNHFGTASIEVFAD